MTLCYTRSPNDGVVSQFNCRGPFPTGPARIVWRRTFVAVVLGWLLSIPVTATAQYAFKTIDVPGSTSTAANGNSTNAIAGEYDDVSGDTHGFILSEKKFTPVDVPRARSLPPSMASTRPARLRGFMSMPVVDFTATSGARVPSPRSIRPAQFEPQAFALNSQNVVVGVYRDAASTRHGFIWSKGAFTTIDHPDAAAPLGTSAIGINDPGEVVGTYVDADGDRHGFVLSKKGVYVTLDVPGALFTVAQGINNRGDIAGLYLGEDLTTHGFVLSEAGFTAVDVPDSDWTEVYSINAQGEIVGAYEDSSGVHGFSATPDCG